MHPRTTQSLLDIVEACEEIETIIAGVSLEAYRRTRIVQLGTERLIITIGEAANRAEEHDAQLISRLTDARNIVGMRNRLVHGYDAVELETVWTAAVAHVPVLKSEVLALLQASKVNADDRT